MANQFDFLMMNQEILSIIRTVFAVSLREGERLREVDK
jgi:hypothetical protein